MLQVLVEGYTGSIFTDILGIDYYNAYQNVGAVGLRLTQAGTENTPAVLIGAHFDSSLGTPGVHESLRPCRRKVLWNMLWRTCQTMLPGMSAATQACLWDAVLLTL